MGQNKPLILKEPPRKLEYINLLLNYDQHHTFLQKAKKFITRTDKTRPHSISEWCEILGSTKNNETTRSFLERLVDEEALVYEDTKGDNPNKYERYRLDKVRLEEVLYEDPWWNWTRDISVRLINNQEPYKKVVTDI